MGVRARVKGNLVAFITGIPSTVRVDKDAIPMVEINFLCVHKKLRSKRLAPVLIKVCGPCFDTIPLLRKKVAPLHGAKAIGSYTRNSQ